MKQKSYLLIAIITIAVVSLLVVNAKYSASEPLVNTSSATMKDSSVTLKGVVTDTGQKDINSYGFKWGTSKNLAQAKKLKGNIEANKTFSVTVRGLKAGTTYYYQAFAANAKGSGYGEIKSFTVPKKPNEVPKITIVKPSDNVSVTRGEKLTISAVAQDDEKVYAMELFINNVSQKKVSADTLSFEWNSGDAAAGDYTVKVSAWDGQVMAEKAIAVSIKEAKPTSPATPAAITTSSVSRGTGASGSKRATASDAYPRLSKVNGSFGQFAYRDLSGGRIQIDPQWIANNIVTITLPGLNQRVQVNKAAADNFIYAFNLIKNGTAIVNGKQVPLLSLIKTMDGTFVTRHVNWDSSRGLSNHSWGTAIDINASGHFGYVDPSNVNDPNLILWEKAFKPAGFSWGNRYSDSMHYELIK